MNINKILEEIEMLDAANCPRHAMAYIDAIPAHIHALPEIQAAIKIAMGELQ